MAFKPPPLRVLVVDDDDVMRALIDMALVRRGYRVTLAIDGAEAVQRLQGGQFDLMVTDIVLPEIDGYEVIKNARRWQEKAKIVAISGGDMKRLPAELALDVAAKLGIDGILAKPFTPDALVELIDGIIGGKQTK